jgi:hypothetical protein
MTDLNTIRVIPFCGKADEWPIWNEKFMAKAKRYGFKDVLTGKLSIPKADEEFDKDLDIGKKMLNAIELNKVAYTELLLSIDVKTSNGKIAFNIVKGCKSKDHPDGNAATAWDKLKNKYKPMSALSMVKLDKPFRDSPCRRRVRILKFGSRNWRHRMQRSLRMTFGFVIVVQVHTIVLRMEACLMLKTSMRIFVLEMGIS